MEYTNIESFLKISDTETGRCIMSKTASHCSNGYILNLTAHQFYIILFEIYQFINYFFGHKCNKLFHLNSLASNSRFSDWTVKKQKTNTYGIYFISLVNSKSLVDSEWHIEWRMKIFLQSKPQTTFDHTNLTFLLILIPTYSTLQYSPHFWL